MDKFTVVTIFSVCALLFFMTISWRNGDCTSPTDDITMGRSVASEALKLYPKYKDDLLELHRWLGVWEAADKSMVNMCHNHMCLEETELLYMRVREAQPDNVFEVGPACGWSSLAILTALVHNGKGVLQSFDLENKAPLVLNGNPELAKHISKRWIFNQGDLFTKYLESNPPQWYLYNYSCLINALISFSTIGTLYSSTLPTTTILQTGTSPTSSNPLMMLSRDPPLPDPFRCISTIFLIPS